MNLTNIEEMQYRINELMELPKDKLPSVLKLVEDLENLYKENKQLKEQLQQKENIVNKAKEKLNHLQTTYGYILDDVIFLLDKGE